MPGQPAQADHPQLSLFSGAPSSAVKRTTVRANRKVAQQTTQAALPLRSKKFLPVVGVPKTRGDCPDTSSSCCPHVRCRFHLFLLEAEHRAGRPGLSSVPRDERGWTTSLDGDMGEEGAGSNGAPALVVGRVRSMTADCRDAAECYALALVVFRVLTWFSPGICPVQPPSVAT